MEDESLSARIEFRCTPSQKDQFRRNRNMSQRLRDALDLLTGDTVDAPEIPADLIDDGLLPIGDQPKPQPKQPKSKGTVIGELERKPNAMVNADRRTPDAVVI